MKLINLLATTFIALTLAMLLGELMVDGLLAMAKLIINDFRRLSRQFCRNQAGREPNQPRPVRDWRD